MITYRHPLDYGIGAKYYLTHEKLGVEFRVNNDNFYVEEIINFNRLGFNDKTGNYIVFILEKRNIDTFNALYNVKKHFNIPVENFIILGLKDKVATTKQYVFIKRELVDPDSLHEDIIGKNYRFKFIGYTLRKPRVDDLVGNKFTIVVNAQDNTIYHKLRILVDKIASRGLPSYYGYQRFGVKRVNTHLLGKYLVLERIDLFIHELLHGIYPSDETYSLIKRVIGTYTGGMVYERMIKVSRDLFSSINKVRSMTRDLYIDAYTSYLYNLLLNKIIEKMGWEALDNEYPTIGCMEYYDEYYRDIAEQELIPESKLIYFKCWFRRGLFKPMNNTIVRRNNSILYSFTLRKGCYASIVLREIFKEDLIY